MIAAAALIALFALTGDGTAAPEIDRTALTWCAVTPAAGANVTLVTADGLHRTIADAQRLVFNPGEIAALANAGQQVPVDMTCTLLEPVAWATVGPAQTTVIDTPADPEPEAEPLPPLVLLEADTPADDVHVAAPTGVEVAVLIPSATAEQDTTAVAASTSSTVVAVPAAVDTVPPAVAPTVRASILGRARAMAIAALQAVS